MSGLVLRYFLQMGTVFKLLALVISTVFVAAVTFPAASSAAPAVTNVSPANGSMFMASGSPFPEARVKLVFNCPTYTTSYGSLRSPSSYFVDVDTSPTMNGSGNVFGGVVQSEGGGRCSAESPFGFETGTYYWRAFVIDVDLPGNENRGPIWSFTVVAPPPSLYMSKGEAFSYLRRSLARDHRARSYRRSCVRFRSEEFRCIALFRKRGGVYLVKYRFWHVRRGGDVYWVRRQLKLKRF